MGLEENKAVVRPFINEVLVGGNLGVIDELLGAAYVNRAMDDADREHFKGMLGGLVAALPVRKFTIIELVGEGDAVVARYNAEMGDVGKTVSMRGLTYYRLAGGQIVEDDPITSPDMLEQLAPLMGSAAGA